MAIPRTSDNRPIYLLNSFPGNVNIAYPGKGDASGLWDGTAFRYECTAAAAGDQTPVEWQFSTWVYLAGGEVSYYGAVWGDELSFDIYAPATVSSAGSTYDKQDVGGGLNRFVPGGSNFDIDLAADGVPVPNETGTGHFDWDSDTNTITANSDGKGGYDLFDQVIPLATFIPHRQVMGGTSDLPINADLTHPMVKPKKILAQWKFRITFHNSADKSTTPFRLIWSIFLGRKKTS